MDFMNFMNQINNTCGPCYGNYNCDINTNNGTSILPLLLLSGLGQNLNQKGNMICYPNSQPQQCITSMPMNYDLGLKYRTRKVKQAYMEVPVSTYQVAQPYCYPSVQQPPINLVTSGGNNNGSFDLCTLLLLLCLGNKFNPCCNIPQRPQPRAYGNCTTTEL